MVYHGLPSSLDVSPLGLCFTPSLWPHQASRVAKGGKQSRGTSKTWDKHHQNRINNISRNIPLFDNIHMKGMCAYNRRHVGYIVPTCWDAAPSKNQGWVIQRWFCMPVEFGMERLSIDPFVYSIYSYVYPDIYIHREQHRNRDINCHIWATLG